MKKITKKMSILTLCLSMFMLSVVPAFAATNTENEETASTIQFSGQNLYLAKGSNNNAVAAAKDGSSSQDFYFEYDSDKMAYKIHSADNSSLVVAWNTDSSNSVVFKNNGDSNENYWVIEEEPSSDKCYLRNYAKATDGYLTALNSNAVLAAKDNKGITVSPSVRNDSTLGNNQYKITSASQPGLTLNRDLGLNVSLYSGDTQSRQKWIFEYFPEKDAYKIKNIDSDNLLTVMAWNSNEDNNVYAYNDLGNDDQFWRLESVGDGNYVIKNYKNPNKVLDIGEVSPPASYNIVVNDRTNAATQMFKLTLI